MKRVRWVLLGLLGIALGASVPQPPESAYSRQNVALFRSDAKTFAAAATDLKDAIAALDGAEPSRQAAIAALRRCRLRYKRIEAFMEYHFQYPVNLYNRAPVYEVEEPYMEYQAPVGLQYIESLLLEPDAATHQKELLDQCEVVRASAADIPALLYGFHTDDQGLLESTRLELIRIVTLGITGYDAPQLKSGVEEAATALQAMSESLAPLLEARGGPLADSVRHSLQVSIDYLTEHPDFDRFDRLAFLTDAALPLQHAIARYGAAQGLNHSTVPDLNPDAADLFDSAALRPGAVAGSLDGADRQRVAALGKALFSETALSGNGSRSCASCHQPERFFTDGRVKSLALDGKQEVQRNAPSLFYTAYQHAQFHDGRAADLQEQVRAVLQSPLEMNAPLDTVVARLNRDAGYRARFRAAWPALKHIDLGHIALALATYEQTLAPFRSPFDRYLAGDRQALRADAKRGFNLFMGKAQCGTCHFAPVFNGSLPPYYAVSEVEVLGVPQRRRGRVQRLDTDSGRYHFFPIAFNNGAFKTTTVRNAAKTAPYMHNGAFRTLDEVLDFYNRGGGRGLGLPVPVQTLSDKPLGLSKAELQDLKAFLEALTDDLSVMQ